MQVHSARILVTLLVAAGAAACAFSRWIPGEPGCFLSADVKEGPLASWAWLDDWTLLIRTRATGNAYLIELSLPVVGLGFRPNLGFDDVEHSGKICSGDYFIVPGYAPERVKITAVRQLSPEQAANFFAAQRQTTTRGGK